MDKGGELYAKLSIISLAILIILLLVIGYLVKQSMKYKTEKEKDASKKGFLAYLLTNSLLIGWCIRKIIQMTVYDALFNLPVICSKACSGSSPRSSGL